MAVDATQVTHIVLTRRVGESIHIGDGAVVTVSEIRGTRVRLRVAAPRDVKVLRAELLPDGGPSDDVV